MAITTRYATNTALQYNEVDLTDFLINPSIGSRRFLTEAEQTRILRATETSALYFITDTSGTFYSARYRWYDSGGTLLNEYILSLSGAGVHNSIPVDWTSFYVPSGAVKLTVAIIGAVNGFANGQFEIGTGNLFQSWTLTQPTRRNLVIQSNNVSSSSWTKVNSTTPAANKITEDNTSGGKYIYPAVNISVSNGDNYTVQCKVKENGRRYILLYDGISDIGAFFDLQAGVVLGNIGAGVLVKKVIIPEDNGEYICSITFTSSSTSAQPSVYLSNNGTSIGYLGNGTSGIFISDIQFEEGNFITPIIPTTTLAVTTSTGEFLQDTTGGPDGSRCIRIWADAAVTTLLSQAVSLIAGEEYILRFRAKANDAREGDRINIVVDATDIGDTFISQAWAWYNTTFTALGTGSTDIYFSFLNDITYGFASFDDVSILPTNLSLLSEERTYLLDDSCVAYEYELNWLNKLGGRDTWVMTGFPTETVDVKRNNEIEYSARTNYTSPNRIYGYRENKSRKSVTLTHQCKDRATAEWLKSELIDTIDLMVLADGIYRPADVVASSIVTSNTFSQDFTVRVTLRYAYDINVQTR